jgi:hypothetical protein
MGARMAAPHCQYAYLSGAVRAAFLPEGSVPRVAVRSGSDRLAAIH